MTGDPALRCSGLVHVYSVFGTDVAALRGLDLVIAPGARVALLGPSGSGKSTLLAIVAGILRPSAGRAEVFGLDLGRASERELRQLRGRTLGLMLQGAATNLLLYDDPAGNIAYAVDGTAQGDAAIGQRVLHTGGLTKDRRPVGRMSPSEQQVVALAVAMATKPKLLLVDEPTSQLDDQARDRLLSLLVEVTQEQGTAVLTVTHDQHVARTMQRMIHLRDGRVAEEATAAGRYAVVGADGSVQLPDLAAETGWDPGSLVTVELTEPGHIHLTLVQRP